MTDKEKKSKIAGILLDFYDEHCSNEINRPMIPSIYAGKILAFMDSLQEEPESEDLEKAAEKVAVETFFVSPKWTEIRKELFKAGANWQREQIAKENMLLPFKEYDNLIESINRQKKEGYEAGYNQGLKDSKNVIESEVITIHNPLLIV